MNAAAPGWGITQITPPAVEPISIDQARAWLRVDGPDQDAIIAMLIKAARRFIERRTNRALITSTWRMTLDRFPLACSGAWQATNVFTGLIRLPRGPITAVSAVNYVDQAGTTQLVAASDYVVDLSREPAQIAPAWGRAWPTPQCRPAAVSVDFTAGYATPDLVPDDLALALRLLVAHWFENRETVTVGVANSVLQMAFDEIVEPYRLWSFQ